MFRNIFFTKPQGLISIMLCIRFLITKGHRKFAGFVSCVVDLKKCCSTYTLYVPTGTYSLDLSNCFFLPIHKLAYIIHSIHVAVYLGLLYLCIPSHASHIQNQCGRQQLNCCTSLHVCIVATIITLSNLTKKLKLTIGLGSRLTDL